MALYHKYRPQQFSEVIGQDHVVKTLSRQIITNTLAHAYVFSGSRGIGKTTISRLFAKAINCTNKKPESAEPCNTCSECIAITSGRSIDVIEIDAASNTGVDNVRENIIENVQFQPTSSKYKVFIIDEVHMLSTSSFNALLKTLEEPPSYVIFILATTELHKIPETILSRCQRYVFGKVPKNILAGILDKIASEEKLTLDPEVKEAIVSKADGGVRDAVSLLDQIMSLGESHITREQASIFLPISPFSDTLTFLGYLFAKNATEALQYIQTLSNGGNNMPAFMETLIETLRALMIVKIQGKTDLLSDLSAESLAVLQNLSEQISSAELLRLIDITLKRRANIKTAPIAELPLELIVLEWVQTDIVASRTSAPSPAQPVAPAPVNEEKKPEPKAEQPPVKSETIVETTPETPAPETPAVSAPKVSPNFQVLKNKWGEVMKCVEKQSPSLVSLLKSSNLLSLEDNMVTLEVQYKLHQDKFNQKEYKLMMEKALEECMGTKMSVRTEVASKNTANSSPADLENIAAAFGGVVV
jgi:DNA polymerase-3 subunit gamma/tau